MLQHYDPTKTSQQLCGVTGHCTELKGPVHVRIEVAGRGVVLPVYVAEMRDQCILGLDYLASIECQLDLASMRFLVLGKPVPGSDVRTVRATIIPPRSEKMIQCHATGTFDGFLGMVEPDS